MANSVYQYEQPRCPDGWNEAERRFYNRLIQVLDDIYAKYGRIDAKLLDKSVINKIETAPEAALDKAVADVISAGNIAADKFQGTFAYLVSLSAKYGDFDFETVKNLVADALVLEQGQANEVHITNLSATYAQAVRATIGSLCIKSKDGGYFQLDVDSEGRVSAVPVDVSEGEIAAGETDSGKVIVGTNVTAEMLNTATLAATQALINTIDAARINVDELVAREAFISALTAEQAFVTALFADEAFLELLRTTKIVGDKSITMIAEDAEGGAIQIVEGASGQAECREGKGIYVYSDFKPMQDLSGGYPAAISGREGLTVVRNDGSFVIQFGTVVYGGHYDWQTGELLVQYGVTSIGNLNWYKGGSGYTERFQTSLPGVEVVSDNAILSSLVCEAFRTEKWSIATTTNADNVIMQAGGSDVIAVKCSAYADVASFLAAVRDVRIAYKLAEPYVIKYARQQILAHDGLNVVSSDADGGRIEFGHDPMDFKVDSIKSDQDDMAKKQSAMDAEQKRVAAYLVLDPDMVRIGKEGATSEFRIDPWGAGVVVNNVTFSRFESDRVRLGNMEIRRPAVGGLAFDSIVGETGVSM